MEREIKIIISEEGEMKIEGGKYTVGELIKVGQGIINLAQNVSINFEGKPGEA